MERLRIVARARVAWLLAALLLLVQLILVRVPTPQAQLEWFERFGLSRSGLVSGRWYELLTHAFLHANWAHLGMNALAVLWFGAGIEWTAGRRNALLVFLAGVLLGGIAHAALVPTNAPASLLVGASGGVMAMFVYLAGLMPDARVRWLGLSFGNIGLGVLIASGLLALMLPTLGVPLASEFGRMLEPSGVFQIGHACHFGGALAGWLAARWTLRPRVDLRQLQRERERREREEEKRRR